MAFQKPSISLWWSKFGGMLVPDAKRLKALESENTRLMKLLADVILEQEVTREVLQTIRRRAITQGTGAHPDYSYRVPIT